MVRGRLVVLSKRGARLKKNHTLLGGFGIVMDTLSLSTHNYIKIRWTYYRGDMRARDLYLKRYEIKYLKPKE